MQDRVNIFPSRANLVLMKQRIVAASRGLNLLKRRRDALEMKLRELTADLEAAREVVDKVMAEAIFSMAKANFLDADMRACELMQIDKADIYMRIRNARVAGILLPQFQLYVDSPASFPLTGLSRGGEQVEVVRENFQDAVRTLVTLASLEYSVSTLRDGVRQNNMRVNGLEYVVLPRFHNTVNYIRDELEEYEREDFYRLKRSQAKQRSRKEKFALLLKMKYLTAEQKAELEKIEFQKTKSISLPSLVEDFDMKKFDDAADEQDIKQEDSEDGPLH
ncbi:PREDICTED: probable V-type proton ATPase subunit D 2 [Bactrocera latifrons]|uniref:Putative V-type proton ATPase subunit D 2 n=1 Tax=Bactrocera latifrons TaxID=174628 RepID=A0A0K8UBT1_BACLA|nr:PREDICTED: probable V-type proton ATPase subunit D 2 [Bactrocera latifrons]